MELETNNSIDRDAHEFALCIKQGGWRMGLLVARNVEISKPGPKKIGENSPNSKVSLTAFAQKAGIAKETVKKYLDAWNSAAENGIVQPSDELKPDEEPEYLDIDTLPSWKSFFQPRKQRETKDKTKEPETNNTTKKTTTITNDTPTTDIIEHEDLTDDNLDNYEDEFKDVDLKIQPYNNKVGDFLGMMFDLHNDYEACEVEKLLDHPEQLKYAIDKLEMTHRALGTYITTIKELLK